MSISAELKLGEGTAQRARAIAERVYGAEHPEVATDAGNVGQILQAKGGLDGALSSIQRALRTA